MFFFFKQKTAYDMRISDWSSDVCSSDLSMMARKLGTSARMLVASPAYLERAGTPRKPADLSSHMLILGPSGMRPDAWVFRSQGKSVSVRLEGRLNISVN